MPLGMDINPLDISKEALKSILGKSIRRDEKIVVPHLKYFQSLKQLLTQMSDYDIANYLIWREIIQMVKMTTNEARQTMETFENIVQGILMGCSFIFSTFLSVLKGICLIVVLFE